MKSFSTFRLLTGVIFLLLFAGCSSSKLASKKKAPNVDLTHWKVTIPTPRADGKAMEVSPPEIFNYPKIEALKDFMYPDSSDGSIVFHAYPASTTANTKYSRTELREQMVSGSNSTNWTFKEGGKMKVKMAIDQVTKDRNGKEHRIIIAQIHGRLSNEQKKSIGQKDNNAPPILKIYYDKGKIRVKTKVLKNQDATDLEILDKKAWGDDAGYNFETPVGKGERFTLEVIVSEGRMEIVLNGWQKKVYKGVDMERWGIFENYFKVGNYFQTRDEGAFGKVKIYELEVSH
ncbi:MAG: polysaccharide lyase family 7 protein [Saprospiraceae bacterium]